MRVIDTNNPFPLRSLLFSIGTTLLLIILFSYVVYQARFLILGPQIVLNSDPAAIQHQPVVELEGQLFNIVSATLNGRTIFTDESGYFKEALILENGYTIATLAVTDRFGRTAAIKRSYVFLPLSPLTP